ncbi:uncharacterized protein BYT42DRAFT_558548 [Radiomyces spectabilis]|uniref:uncharacterized protein n=1 Tax=Radiomyces spectabilis TaxID=64574 RepID=UPI00221EDD94|nr:uncharacterized protein BYT42DRAFT_558548 [Radiomyces spectabilis]KAI8387996.1 hypothetical protein BYT42DRAFT_558548 [Radiomyces spectabilis]
MAAGTRKPLNKPTKAVFGKIDQYFTSKPSSKPSSSEPVKRDRPNDENAETDENEAKRRPLGQKGGLREKNMRRPLAMIQGSSGPLKDSTNTEQAKERTPIFQVLKDEDIAKGITVAQPQAPPAAATTAAVSEFFSSPDPPQAMTNPLSNRPLLRHRPALLRHSSVDDRLLSKTHETDHEQDISHDSIEPVKKMKPNDSNVGGSQTSSQSEDVSDPPYEDRYRSFFQGDEDENDDDENNENEDDLDDDPFLSRVKQPTKSHRTLQNLKRLTKSKNATLLYNSENVVDEGYDEDDPYILNSPKFPFSIPAARSPSPSPAIEFSVSSMTYPIEFSGYIEDENEDYQQILSHEASPTRFKSPPTDSTVPYPSLPSDLYDTHEVLPVPRGKDIIEKLGITSPQNDDDTAQPTSPTTPTPEL